METFIFKLPLVYQAANIGVVVRNDEGHIIVALMIRTQYGFDVIKRCQVC